MHRKWRYYYLAPKVLVRFRDMNMLDGNVFYKCILIFAFSLKYAQVTTYTNDLVANITTHILKKTVSRIHDPRVVSFAMLLHHQTQ